MCTLFISNFAHGLFRPECRYNSSEHPIPFHKAQDLGKVPKKLAGGPAPDLEEAYVSLFRRSPAQRIINVDYVMYRQIDDMIEDVSDDESKTKADSEDPTKDSLIKASKKKKATIKKSWLPSRIFNVSRPQVPLR